MQVSYQIFIKHDTMELLELSFGKYVYDVITCQNIIRKFIENRRYQRFIEYNSATIIQRGSE